MGTFYTQLSLQERRRIEGWRHPKVPVGEIVENVAKFPEISSKKTPAIGGRFVLGAVDCLNRSHPSIKIAAYINAGYSNLKGSGHADESYIKGISTLQVSFETTIRGSSAGARRCL